MRNTHPLTLYRQSLHCDYSSLETPYYWLDDDPPLAHQIHKLGIETHGFPMDVFFSKNRGWKITPKMDGENHGIPKPIIKMDDLGVPWGSIIFGNTHMLIVYEPFQEAKGPKESQRSCSF